VVTGGGGNKKLSEYKWEILLVVNMARYSEFVG